MEPYLDSDARRAFDAWLEDARERCIPPLTFSEVRKGVQALSSLYVERRKEGGLAHRALEGRGKRAAFATFYAPLHFLVAHHASALLGEHLGGVKRVLDLGCGTGAAGAAAASACGGAPVTGLDRSGWALGEARRTYAAFGLAARTRRVSLPGALPGSGEGDLLVAGWVTNELEPPERDSLLAALLAARRRGARLLLIEPLAGAASAGWEAWLQRFAEQDVTLRLWKQDLELPDWIERMDRAAGLRHHPLGARLLLG